MGFVWTATITGRPASKKNSRRNFGRVSLPSLAYERFHTEAMGQLLGKTPKDAYTGDVMLEIDLYIKGRLRQDWDNAAASIGDLLQDAGVIADDDQVVVGTVIKHRGAPDWKTEIRVSATS